MAKVERATDKLNLALSRVSAAASISKRLAEELPASETRRRLIIGCDEMERGAKDAFDSYVVIRKAAESI